MLRDEKGEYFSIAHLCTTGYAPEVVRANIQLLQYALDMYFLLTKIVEEKKCNAKEVRALLERIRDESVDDDETKQAADKA